jgi:chromosomal replication initiation ATPase DnaA
VSQLALPFDAAASYADEDFIFAPSNAAARTWLATPSAWSQGRLILCGEPGCGKTHLLHIWARARGAVLLDGKSLTALAPSNHPLAIDDADQLPDEALLHALNRAAEAGRAVLLTARLPPARQQFTLPDLASRLRASQVVAIAAPEDELLAALLTRLAAERQLVLGPDVQKYLLAHLPRTPAALRHAIARLDHAALAGNRKISRAFAAALLNDLPAGGK